MGPSANFQQVCAIQLQIFDEADVWDLEWLNQKNVLVKLLLGVTVRRLSIVQNHATGITD
jgi:hypothetical protein